MKFRYIPVYTFKKKYVKMLTMCILCTDKKTKLLYLCDKY